MISLLPVLKSPWELILTEPVPKVVEFRPADSPEKYFSGESARRSCRATLSPSFVFLILFGRSLTQEGFQKKTKNLFLRRE